MSKGKNKAPGDDKTAERRRLYAEHAPSGKPAAAPLPPTTPEPEPARVLEPLPVAFMLTLDSLWIGRAEKIAKARGLDVNELFLELLRRAWVQLPSDKRGPQ